jgi:type I restriction enzyme S subunit
VNKDKLLASLPVIFESSHGVQSLYSLLKSLAIRGKMNVNCLENCSIDELTSDLKSRKNLFMNDHGLKVKRNDPANEISALGFELPTNWGLVPLREICFAQAGFAFSASHFNSNKEGIPLIRIRDIERGFSETYYSGEFRPEFLVKKGDWLIGMDGNFNVRQWQGETALLNQRVTRLHFFDDRINQLFISLALEEHLHSLMGTKSYTTVDHLSTKQIEVAPIPLPCLNEQNSVISCMIELKTNLDKLQETQNLVRDLNSAARKSAIDAISTAHTATELQIAWQRVQTNWEVIAGSTEAIDAVRTLILDLAIRGQIAPHDHSGVSAEELIKESIQMANRKKSTPARGNQQTPFQIPKHWEWSTIEDLCDTQTGATPKIHHSDNAQDLIHYVTAADMVKLKAVKNRSVPISAAKRGGRIAPKDSVLFVGIGATIGKSCLISSPATFNQQIHAATPRNISAQYLCLILASGYFQKICKERTNATAIPILNKSKWETIPVPVPPLNEQKKIAQTVSELFKLCDELESILTIKSSIVEKFSRSVVSASA